MSPACTCGNEVMDDVTETWAADVHDDSERIYLASSRQDYRVAQAWRCPECGAVHARYRVVR